MSSLKLYSGPHSALDQKDIEEGSIYFTTDTKKIIVDLPEGDRTSYSEKENLTEISHDEIDAIFEKYPFQYQENAGGTPADLDTIYDYVLEKLLADPKAVFKGATADSDGQNGLLPQPPSV